MRTSGRTLTVAALATSLGLLTAGCAPDAVVGGGSAPATAERAGAGAGASSPTAGTTVLAKADTWRPALAPLAPRYYGIMEIAGDPASAERAWAENAPSGGVGDSGSGHRAPPVVDLSRQAVVVWSSGESSSCPVDLVTVSTTAGRLDITIGDAAASGRVCTDDYVSYRMVLAVDRDRLPAVNRLPNADVLVDGTAFVAPLLVTTYPATEPGGAPRR